MERRKRARDERQTTDPTHRTREYQTYCDSFYQESTPNFVSSLNLSVTYEMQAGGIKPGIIILREGTDTSQVSESLWFAFKWNKANSFLFQSTLNRMKESNHLFQRLLNN